MTLEKNELYESEDGTPRPRGTGIASQEKVDLVFTAVGYRGIPLAGVPFNDRRGVLSNRAGRIYDPASGAIVPHQYVVGWAKRGPTGLIGSNVADANATVELVLEDLREGRIEPASITDPKAIPALLESRGVHLVTFNDWRRLDAAEVEAGEKVGKIREKFTRVTDMLQALS